MYMTHEDQVSVRSLAYEDDQRMFTYIIPFITGLLHLNERLKSTESHAMYKLNIALNNKYFYILNKAIVS